MCNENQTLTYGVIVALLYKINNNEFGELDEVVESKSRLLGTERDQ